MTKAVEKPSTDRGAIMPVPPRDRPADPRIAENAERIGIAVERMKAARARGIVLPPLRPAAECEVEAVERLLPFKR